MNDLRRQVGRTLMIGLPGPELDSETAERVRRLRPGGVILFGRNLESPPQTARLLVDVRSLTGSPLLCALDQEGGRVSRLAPWVGPTPTAAALAVAGPEVARRFGERTAASLRSLGFNLDFAPVVDLSAADASNGIGDRSFGTEPESVAVVAGAFLDGLQAAGVAGCLKHFPGLGPTDVDSHQVLPTAERDEPGLRRLDLAPFRRLAARAATVMIGHGHYPALDPRPELPATLSAPIVRGLLRDEFGYRGLVVSDDLEMGAVAPLDEDGRAAVQAIEAGCDLLLYCAKLERAEAAATALERAATNDTAFSERLAQAADAVLRCSQRWDRPSPAPLSWERASRDLAAFAKLT